MKRVTPPAFSIRETGLPDTALLATLVRDAFQDVAARFALTPENCPKHPSNCTVAWIETALERGIRYYILEIEQTPCGCVALEQASSSVCYLERLAVLPAYQHRGLGTALVEHVLATARTLGASRVEIGVIAEDTDLVAWYQKRGFITQARQRFEHLPFEVLFMYAGLG